MSCSAAPIISVVIPTRHRNGLLSLCLDRLKPGIQTLDSSQYEVIVTDDGAQSTAQAMVRDRYPWATWVKGPRKGPAANRNCGATTARSQWIAFTDDDCLPGAGWLAGFLAGIAPEMYVYEGRTTCEGGIASPLYDAPLNLTGGWLWSCNMMISRDLFRQMGGFDENFPYAHMEDVDFRERLRVAHVPFDFVPDAVVDHPARPLQPGFRRASTHECDVIYWRKWGQPVRPAVHLLNIAKDRLRKLRRHRLSFDSFIATTWMIEEIIGSAVSYPKWLRNHSPAEAMGQDALSVKNR